MIGSLTRSLLTDLPMSVSQTKLVGNLSLAAHIGIFVVKQKGKQKLSKFLRNEVLFEVTKRRFIDISL